MISPEERYACTRGVESAFSHLEARDAEELAGDLEGLKEFFVYSNYPFWKDWEAAKPRMVRLLFEELPFERFLEVVAGRNFSPFNILPALDELAESIPIAQLTTLCERFRFPQTRTAPNIVAKLAVAPEVEVTLWLRRAIEPSFQDGKAQDFNSLYAYSLAHIMEILARRRDEMALSTCANYLRERRFGEKGNPVNRALLDGLASQETEASRQLLLSQLESETSPSELRIIVLAKVTRFEPRQALAVALADLQRVRDSALRESYLSWFWHNRERLETAAKEVSPQVDTKSWSPVSQATLVDVWQRGYPFWPVPSSFSTRAIFFLTAQFERLSNHQLNWKHLTVGAFTAGSLYLWLLNRLVGPPLFEWRWLERTPGLSWIDVVLLILVWTPFCGFGLASPPPQRLMLPERWSNAIVFFNSATLFLLGCLFIRLWARWFLR